MGIKYENNKQQTTNNKQQTTNNKQQTTNNKQQTTNNKQQTTNNKQLLPSVAVITTTIGRNSLEKAIHCIRNQTYPCKHYIFVDGKQYWHLVEPFAQKYPEVQFVFLPTNTGGNGITNGAIHAVLPYLLKEDIFCFLDDDNWHDPEHVEILVNMINKHQLDYAYSLRRLYDQNLNFLAEDYCGSVGFWTIEISVEHNGSFYKNNSAPLIDTNSYAITRQISFQLTDAWYNLYNDRYVTNKLLEINARGGATGKITTNYKYIPVLNPNLSLTVEDWYEIAIKQHALAQEQGFDQLLTKPSLLINGVFHQLD